MEGTSSSASLVSDAFYTRLCPRLQVEIALGEVYYNFYIFRYHIYALFWAVVVSIPLYGIKSSLVESLVYQVAPGPPSPQRSASPEDDASGSSLGVLSAAVLHVAERARAHSDY